jgi:hypothetical protein
MAEVNYSEKSVKLLSFSGEHKDFQIWWVRFWAYATVHKIVKALHQDGGEQAMPPTVMAAIDEATDAGKVSAAALRRNAVAMAHFTMAFYTEARMGIVYMAQSTDCPTGLAHLVVKFFFKKYTPADTISRVELRQKLNKVSMKKGDDPAVIFEQISSIRNQFNNALITIDNDNLIAVVLDAATVEYQSVLTSEQRNKGANLTIGYLESAMTQQWRQVLGITHAETEGT